MLSIWTLLKKDLDWSKHHLRALVVLVAVVPAVFAAGTLFFEHTLPENAPVAVTPAGENVSTDDLNVTRGALTFISDPVVVRSTERAFTKLTREEVYAVVEVPAGLTSPDGPVTVDVYVHGTVTIFRLPSRALVTLLSRTLDGTLPGQVQVDRHVVGPTLRLSEYLFPTFLMLVVMLVAFTYVPTALAAEERVFDRLRTKSSMDALLAAKLAFFLGLVAVSIVVASLVGYALGYALEPLSIAVFGVYLLTFLYLAAVSTAVMLVTGFATTGRVLNVALFFGLIIASNLAYPAGSFSPLSKAVARSNPLHYSMIIARSHLLKDVSLGLFADWFAGLVGVTVGCLVALKLSLAYYERVQ